MSKNIQKLKGGITELRRLANNRADIRGEEFLNAIRNVDEPIYDAYAGITGPDIQLFRENTQERLANAERKKEMAGTNPVCGIFDAVGLIDRKIRSFLKRYNLGFHKAWIKNGGILKVQISCIIHPPHDSFHEQTETHNAVFTCQLAELKSRGIDIALDVRNPQNACICATEESMNSIKQLLMEEFDAGYVKFSVWDLYGHSALEYITFGCRPEVVAMGKWDEFSWDLPDFADGDLKAHVQYLVTHIADAYTSVTSMPSLLPSCAPLIVSLFSELCEIAGYDGKTRKFHEDRISTERNANKEINRLETEAGMTAVSSISDAARFIEKMLDRHFVSRAMARLSELRIYNRYMEADFKFVRGRLFMHEHNVKPATEEYMEKTFLTNGGNYKDETFMVQAVSENFDAIQRIATDTIPKAMVSKFDIQNLLSIGTNYIHGFTLYADNLIDVTGFENGNAGEETEDFGDSEAD